MKQIIKYFQLFWRKDFHPAIYGLAALFLIVAISLNYHFNFEDDILDSQWGKWYSWPLYFIYFAIPYYFVIVLYLLFKKEVQAIKSRKFWFKTLFALALISFKVFFFLHYGLIPKNWAFAEQYGYGRIVNRLVSLAIYTIGMVSFYKFFETQNRNWYGFTTKGFNWKPYVVMLLIMVPLIGAAATQDDFLAVYPKLRPEYFQQNYWKWFAAYEPLYMGEFVMVEWFFRGFLVVGMVRLMGHRAVLPMTVLYCTFHFGKPLGECIGSIFGGYILGIIAYYSRSVWGGIIVHMGIAFLMDLAAFMAKGF